MANKPAIPITVITGFVGSGKTTLILNLLPQLRRTNSSYKLALVKNEIGDLNIDSQLASSAQMTGTRELLGACICCTNVGQIGDALSSLDSDYSPDRIVIETSGSAEPLKLVLEIKRLSQETGSRYDIDGVISVVDVQNWEGYSSTSYTAKLQAKQTDVIVLNKWEEAGEQRADKVLDMLGDMDVDTPIVKSDKGWVSPDLLFGLDSKMAEGAWERTGPEQNHNHDHSHADGEQHKHNHNEEMECLSITLRSSTQNASLDLPHLLPLLQTAPKDEVYRIKALVRLSSPPSNTAPSPLNRYILNWSFGRYTWTADGNTNDSNPALDAETVARISVFLARYESSKWTKRIEGGGFVVLEDGEKGELSVKRVL